MIMIIKYKIVLACHGASYFHTFSSNIITMES
jgi:hypothetical protein